MRTYVYVTYYYYAAEHALLVFNFEFAHMGKLV